MSRSSRGTWYGEEWVGSPAPNVRPSAQKLTTRIAADRTTRAVVYTLSAIAGVVLAWYALPVAVWLLGMWPGYSPHRNPLATEVATYGLILMGLVLLGFGAVGGAQYFSRPKR